MRFTLKIGENKITVPYAPQVHSDSENHGYMDLRADPSLISMVPEVQSWPELRSMLEAINGPLTPFRSLGCEKSYSRYENPEFPHLTTELVSYVDVAFLSMRLNSRAASFEEMMEAFSAFASTCSFEKFVMFDAELTNANYKAAGVRGFCLSIWCGGFGSNETEARKAWGTVVSVLTSFFSSGWTPNFAIEQTSSNSTPLGGAA